MRIMVSACLLGVNCRYDGGHTRHEGVLALEHQHELVPVCPEQLGGLSTPRPPAEQSGDQVFDCHGRDVASAFCKGAQEALKLYQALHCQAAILKEHSPSCGVGYIYDGTFTGTLASGDGITAALFKEQGIQVLGESALDSTDESLFSPLLP